MPGFSDFSRIRYLAGYLLLGLHKINDIQEDIQKDMNYSVLGIGIEVSNTILLKKSARKFCQYSIRQYYNATQ